MRDTPPVPSPAAAPDPGPPLDTELARLASAAARGALATMDGIIARGGWIPRVLPTVEAFDSGWPHLSKGTSARPDGPPDHAAMLGETRKASRPLA